MTVTPLGPAGRLPVEFAVPGVPVSAQTHNRKNKQEWQTLVSRFASIAWGVTAPTTDSVAVTITMYAPGGWRLDPDNMAKPILDAMTGVVWVDDRQALTVESNILDLDGAFHVNGMSPVLAAAFVAGTPFVHIRVEPARDPTVLP